MSAEANKVPRKTAPGDDMLEGLGRVASSGYVLCYSKLLEPGDPSTKEVTIVGLAYP